MAAINLARREGAPATIEDRDSELISEAWLRASGFKWQEIERSPNKHWTLWLGGAREGACVLDPWSLGIELTLQRDERWHMWIRSDVGGRYARVIHIRDVSRHSDVVALIEAMIGRPFVSAHAMYGLLLMPEAAESRLRDRERLDQRINLAWVDRVDRERGVKDKDRSGVVRP